MLQMEWGASRIKKIRARWTERETERGKQGLISYANNVSEGIFRD